jgi:hypothetical protein
MLVFEVVKDCMESGHVDIGFAFRKLLTVRRYLDEVCSENAIDYNNRFVEERGIASAFLVVSQCEASTKLDVLAVLHLTRHSASVYTLQ